MRTIGDPFQHTSTDEGVLYTIGYEKRSLAEYIAILQSSDVALVIDVRRNPLSRKKGFSKKALSGALSDAGIAYRHLPELGIESSLRKNLKGPDDYKVLFQDYEESMLPQNTEALKVVEELILRFDRVALTCFELDHNNCHRHCVAKTFIGRYPVINL
jgi:uncharacterized protein (DUF488 family)